MVSLLSPSKLLLAAVAAIILDATHAVEFFMPEWVIPQEIGTPYPTMTVNVGDSLTFSWGFGTHDVWIYPSGTCDPTGGIQIGTVQDNPTTYTFGEEDGGNTLTFVCDVGAHCNAGMIMDVVVLATADDDAEEQELAIEEEEEEMENILEEIIEEEEATEAPEILLDGDDEVEDDSDPAGDVEEGTFGVCNVCGDANGSFANPDATVSLPPSVPGTPPFVVQCGQLFQDGLDGKIPDASCPFITDFAAEPCGCVDPNFSCNICGEDDGVEYEVRSPSNQVVLPSNPASAVTCSELAASGFNRELSPRQCSEATLYGFERCQCTPVDFSCSICGEGYVVNNPDVVVDSPDLDGTYTCAELEVAGFGGVLSPFECVAAQSLNRITNTCGCIPEGGYDECLICGSPDLVPQTPEVNLTLTPVDTETCGFFYEAGIARELGPARCDRAQLQAPFACNCAPVDFQCNVCGGDGTNVTMLNPENNFTVPVPGDIGFLANCGEVDAAGVDGIITPTDCSIISPIVQTQCGCAPTGFMCNICGEDSLMTITEADFAFIPGETTTCAEAQAAGLAGQIDSLRCAAITPFAQFACGCEAGGTVSPVMDDDDQFEVALSTGVPSVMADAGATADTGTMAPEITTEESTPTADATDPLAATNTDADTDADVVADATAAPEGDASVTPATADTTPAVATEETTTAGDVPAPPADPSLVTPPDSTASAAMDSQNQLNPSSGAASVSIGGMALAATLLVVTL